MKWAEKWATVTNADVARWAFAAATVLSFILCLYLLLQDRTAAGTVAAVLTMSMGLFCYLPTIDSFSALGLSAQFNRRIAETDRQIELLRDVVSAVTRAQFLSLAWANRMGSALPDVKREQVKNLTDVMLRVGISEPEISKLSEPFVGMSCFDLVNAYFRQCEKLCEQPSRVIAQTLLQAEFDKKDEPTLNALRERQKSLRVRRYADLHRLNSAELKTLMEREKEFVDGLSRPDITQAEIDAIEKLRAETLTLVKGCIAEGNLSVDAIAFLRKMNAT